MAMMNPLQQRLLMERLRRDPRMAALIAARQQGGGGLAELAGLPQGAANLAEIAGLAPEPQVVTPAQPAPVEPGAEVQAPAAREMVAGEAVPPIPVLQPQQAENLTGQPQPPKAMSPLERARATAAQIEEAAIAQRKLSPEVADIYSGREKRYEEELGELDVDRKRAGWEALAMAGFKMAQSQSPYFMSALASGMEAGLSGFNAKKMERAERKARLQTAREQVVLDRETRLDAAEAKERARQLGGLEITDKVLRLGATNLAAKLGEETYPYAVEEAKLKPQEARARIAGEEASTGLKQAQAGYYGRSPGAGDAAAGFGKGEASVIGSLQRAIIADNKIIADGLSSPAAKKAAAARVRVNQETLDQLLRRKPGAAAPAGTTGGGGAAAFRYDPKTGKLIPNR